MTDEQQLALAMQMSIAAQQPEPDEVKMDTGDADSSSTLTQTSSGVAEVTGSGEATKVMQLSYHLVRLFCLGRWNIIHY